MIKILLLLIVLFNPVLLFANEIKVGGISEVIKYDAQSEGTGTTSLSWTHTPVGTPKAVVVFCVANTSASDVFSGATYGGTAMTQITNTSDSVGEPGFIEAYFLGASIPTGAQTVVCTISSGTTAKWGGAFSLTNALGSNMESLGSCVTSADAVNCGCTVTPTKSELSFHVFGQFHGANTPYTTGRTSYTLRNDHDFTSQTTHSGTIIRNVARESGPSTGVVGATDDCANIGIAIGIQ